MFDTDIIMLAHYDEELLLKKLMRYKKEQLVDIIVSLAKKAVKL